MCDDLSETAPFLAPDGRLCRSRRAHRFVKRGKKLRSYGLHGFRSRIMSGERFVDVRMRGFRQRAEVSAVLALLNARITPLPGEPVPLGEAAGRVLAEA